jgi:glyoxylase-like metal-dependent hydrolase (beta-lactamase superfamily II)
VPQTRHTSDPFPPVERLRPGLWTIPVPLPSSSLRYVFVYLFESDRGAYLVDAGWNTEDAYAALTAGLDVAGYASGDVRGVLVTHIHPDHYGLAGRIREVSGAWVALHPADAALVRDRYTEPTDLLERVGTMLRRVGAPAEEIATLQRPRRAPSPPRRALPRNGCRHRRWRDHGMGHRSSHALVAPVGRDRGLHAAGRGRRGAGPPPRP